MVKMKKQTFCFKQLLLIAFGVCSVSTFVYGSTQNVTVSGAVNNSSSGSGKAMINVGSTVGKSVGNNTQNVVEVGDFHLFFCKKAAIFGLASWFMCRLH